MPNRKTMNLLVFMFKKSFEYFGGYTVVKNEPEVALIRT